MICRIYGGRLRAKSATPPANPNLLAGLPWIQGSNTVMTIAAGRVRATNSGGNPRVFKHVTGLTIGATYNLQGNVYRGDGEQNIFFRVSTTIDLPDGNEFQQSGIDGFTVDGEFQSSSTEIYVGIVPVTTEGQYAEIDEAFLMIRA